MHLPADQRDALRYLVFADRALRRLLAAFADEGDTRSYLHLHCPCSGVLVDRLDIKQATADGD